MFPARHYVRGSATHPDGNVCGSVQTRACRRQETHMEAQVNPTPPNGDQPSYSSRSRGKSRPSTVTRATRTSSQRSGGKLQIHGPRSPAVTERIHSGFSTEATPRPSSGFSATSQGSPRICVENGMTGTSLPARSSESRPRTNTGRRLSGDENRYQRISPRLSSRRAMRHWHPADLAVRALPTREECGFALQLTAPVHPAGAARASHALVGPPAGVPVHRELQCYRERHRSQPYA
jgi:hypothetical protein